MASCGVLVDKAEPAATVEPTAESAVANPQPRRLKPHLRREQSLHSLLVLSYSLASLPNLPPITAEDFAVAGGRGLEFHRLKTRMSLWRAVGSGSRPIPGALPYDERVVTRLFL
jgi:hypothetical protein